MKTILVIDMLNDFTNQEKGTLYIPDSEKLIPVINRLITANPAVPVIFANDAHTENDIEFKDYPPHAVAGTWGSLLNPAITPPPQGRFLHKKTLDCFFNTGLLEYLQPLSTCDLYITGVVTEICVRIAALKSLKAGLKDVKVVLDACQGLNLKVGDTSRAILEMLHGGVKLISADEAYTELTGERQRPS